MWYCRGGSGTLDELAEILTRVPTGKTRIPILSVQRHFWDGLLHWFRATLAREGAIAASDLGLFEVVDNPHEVVDPIFKYYEHRGFGLSADEQEILLYL